MVKVGEKANLKANVHATDTCGNDITSKIITIGHYTFDQVGEYDIKYKVTDAIGSVAEKTVKLKVVEKSGNGTIARACKECKFVLVDCN